MKPIAQFWSYPSNELFKLLETNSSGLGTEAALDRLKQQQQHKQSNSVWRSDILLFFRQYKNPLVLLLLIAVILSLILGEYSDSAVILLVLLSSGLFGFIQERKAAKAVQKLQSMLSTRSLVLRDGLKVEIQSEHIVAGDIIYLNAGDIIPADSMILEANDLHVNQSALTGESYPSEKFVGICGRGKSLMAVSNAVFKGTSVINGTATVLAVNVGEHTEVGKIATKLSEAPTETAFEKGIRQFGFLLMRLTIGISLFVLILNILFNKPPVDSLLFSLALAVGITPELLPAIVTVTLSAGARRMASKNVIVKKLNAIQNLGEMNILCSDKTGTLTEGVVEVYATLGVDGSHSERVKSFSYYNACFETGFSNPIDEAIRRTRDIDLTSCKKKDEVPYDFIRKRLSIVVEKDGEHIMITKGAVVNVLECCSQAERPDGSLTSILNVRNEIEILFGELSSRGIRTIGVSYKIVTDDPVINKDDETAMIFLGFVCFVDPLKNDIIESINDLEKKGVTLILITGDNHMVAKHVAYSLGLTVDQLITGSDLQIMSFESLQQKVRTTKVFAEIEPMQKEIIVRALQKNGSVVGFLGDGINDANALKTADVGISVDTAADVAKDAADIVLMERDLRVIITGIEEGRKTFTNTLKYIFVTTSANFGNMVSMAVFSLAIPFLPLLPIQILLNNFLSDIPALAIASDRVDQKSLEKPTRWNVKLIKRFMFIFGLQSSVFDFVTFALLLYVFQVSRETFRTGWFVESLLTEILILLVIRTQHSIILNRPSKQLAGASFFTFCFAIIFPYLPIAGLFELHPLPWNVLLLVVGIALLYTASSEMTKKILFRSKIV